MGDIGRPRRRFEVLPAGPTRAEPARAPQYEPQYEPQHRPGQEPQRTPEHVEPAR